MRELSLNVMDVAQNCLSAGAGLVEISLVQAAGELIITVKDNGRGMTAEQVRAVTDPFYTTRTTRDVGLGVPLFKMAAEQTGGGLSVSSEPGVGTTITAAFKTGHIDMTPVGDMAGTVLLLVCGNPDIDFVYTRKENGGGFTLDTREMRGILGEDVALNDPGVAEWLKDWLSEAESTINN